MKADDGADADVEDRGDEQDEAEARENLRAEEFESREGSGMQPLEEAALAVAQYHISDTEQAAEHHVHAENARKQPVDIAQRRTAHRLAAGAGLRGEQQLLNDVALGRVGIHPVTWRGAEIH